MSEVEKLKKELTKKPKKKPIDGLSTGSTLLNLACSGRPDWGFIKGHYNLFVGDSASGKTFIALTCLAEAAHDARFADYRFIYDDVEGGALMNIKKFFGKKTAARMEPPSVDDDGLPVYSTTIEEFYFHVDTVAQAGAPFIYILDSMDGLSAEDDESKFEERKEAYEKGKQVSGSYGTSKAKANSVGLRRVIKSLRKTGSILLVISQTRENIGFGSQFNPKTRGGGKALRFYATLEMWSSIRKKIKKTALGQPREIGIMAEVEIKKNRLTGRESSVCVPIYWSHGIDDVGSCVQWLIDEKHWTKSGGIVTAPECDYKGSQEKLVQLIEEQGMEGVLQATVADVWTDIEAACRVKRKQRYQ